jgi:hypothetical protein
MQGYVKVSNVKPPGLVTWSMGISSNILVDVFTVESMKEVLHCQIREVFGKTYLKL